MVVFLKIETNMVIEDIIISTFSNIKAISNPVNIPLYEWLAKIKSGELCKEVIRKIRESKDHNEQNYLKTRLLGIGCVSGIFSERKDSGLLKMNQVICLDLDEVNNIRTEVDRLKGYPEVASIFTSPSGKGLKVIVAHDIEDATLHASLYHQLGALLGVTGRNDLTFDPACSNISRACFNSYSRDMFINKNPEPIHIEKEELLELSPPSRSTQTKANTTLTKKVSNPITFLTDLDEIREAIVKEHDFFEKYYSMYPGNRNTNLYLLASFFKDSRIPEKYASDYLAAYYSDRSNGFSGQEIINTIKSAYKL